jgi:hypothetical protein
MELIVTLSMDEVHVLNKAVNTLCGTNSDIEPSSDEADLKMAVTISSLE